MRPTIIPLAIWLGVLLFVIGIALLMSGHALAEPLAEARQDNVRVVIYSEPCQLKEISNLPKRATWEEGGKLYEGCWGGRADIGLVIAYFADRTVAAILVSAFVRVHSL